MMSNILVHRSVTLCVELVSKQRESYKKLYDVKVQVEAYRDDWKE